MLLLAPLATALPLVSETFPVAGLPAGWRTTAGATQVDFEDGAIVLRVGKGARKFATPFVRVEMRGVRWLRVSARMRTEAVVGDGACNVYVRIGDGEVQGTPALSGTRGWTSVVRYFPVPPAVYELELGLTLTTAGTAWFDDVLAEPVEVDARSLSRGRFTYHWIGREGLTEAQLAANDDALDRFAAALGVDPGRVEYRRWASLDEMEQFTGWRGDSRTVGDTIDTLLRQDDHELAHAAARSLGGPPPLFAEGLAVHLADGWNGKDVRYGARAATAKVPDLLETFGATDEAHAVAGAFVRWIVETKGVDVVKALFAATKAEATPKENRLAIEKAVGMSLEDAQDALRRWVEG